MGRAPRPGRSGIRRGSRTSSDESGPSWAASKAREARQFEEQLGEAYDEGMKHQPPGWEDSPELSAEVERAGGLDYEGQRSFDAHQQEARGGEGDSPG